MSTRGKRFLGDIGQTARDPDLGYSIAVVKSVRPQVGHALRNEDICEVFALVERAGSDAGYACRNYIAFSGISVRVVNEQRLSLVEENPIRTTVRRVERIHGNSARERVRAYAGDARRNEDIGQIRTGKRTRADGDESIR